MSPFSTQAPRPFSAARAPAYPRLAAVGLLLSGVACQPTGSATTQPATSERPPTSAPGPAASVVVPATSPPTAVAGTEPANSALTGEAGPRFEADALALEINNTGCRGDCPSPFQMAVHKKDEAQVLARAAFCSRSHPGEGTASIRGEVDREGHVTKVTFEPATPAPPEAMLACVRKLVETGKFTAPEGSSESRPLYVVIRAPVP